MTDNLERPAQQEILEWQKDEFLGDLWNEIQGNNPDWLYIKQVKNPEKAKKQLKEVEEKINSIEIASKTPSIGMPGSVRGYGADLVMLNVRKGELTKGYVRENYNPLHEKTSDSFALNDLSSDVNGRNTVCVLQKAIEEADKSGAKDFKEWSEKFNSSLEKYKGEYGNRRTAFNPNNLYSNNPYNNLTAYNPDKDIPFINTDIIDKSIQKADAFSRQQSEEEKVVGLDEYRIKMLKEAKDKGLSDEAIKTIDLWCHVVPEKNLPEPKDLNAFKEGLRQFATRDPENPTEAKTFLQSYVNNEPVEIDPNKKEKIEQWMNRAGLGDRSDEIIRAYGEQTYAVVQNAMNNPADMSKLTDGTYRNSKNTLLYLLENKEAMKDKVSELQIVKTPKQPKEPEYRAPKFEDTEMAKLNLNVSELEIPETIAIQPLALNYGLSKEDADKVKFASAMKTALNKGIEGYYSEDVVQDACDKVFKACINDEKMNSDINEWSLAFTNKLVEELGISNDVDGDNDEFQKLTNPIFDVRYNIVSNLKNGTDLGIIDSNYVEQARTAQKEAVKRDMKNQEGEIVENADTIEKGEKVEKRLTFRERCKKGWDRVVGWLTGTKEEMVAYDEPTNEQQGNTGEFIEIAPVYSTTKHGSER